MRNLLKLLAIAAVGLSLGACATTIEQIGALSSVDSDPSISAENKSAIKRCAQQRTMGGFGFAGGLLAGVATSAVANSTDDCAIADQEWATRKQREARAQAN